MNIRPSEMKLLDPDHVQITWSDGEIRNYAIAQLRNVCPCATCREKRKAPPTVDLLPVITPDPPEATRLKGMNPVGNYAYGIAFADGHDTGIFTFEFLRELGEVVG
jgi:DUF971 family protein